MNATLQGQKNWLVRSFADLKHEIAAIKRAVNDSGAVTAGLKQEVAVIEKTVDGGGAVAAAATKTTVKMGKVVVTPVKNNHAAVYDGGALHAGNARAVALTLNTAGAVSESDSVAEIKQDIAVIKKA